MNLVVGLGLSSTWLVGTAFQGGWMLYPLVLTLAMFFGLHWWRGWAPLKLLKMMAQGMRQSLGVLSTLMLIGGLMAAWMASGTVATLVYYGLQLIHPRWFLLLAFILTGTLSVLIGTSFGVVGTLGLALMVMARSGGGDLHWAAGAIIAGAYVGDRCSPMSSSAHLISLITETDIYQNLKGMVMTSLGPLVASCGIYGLASWQYPLTRTDQALQVQMQEVFELHWTTLGPAISLLLLVALRVPVKRTMLVSLGLAILLAIDLQGYTLLEVSQFLAMGFHLNPSLELAEIFHGGGLLPMARVCLVVLVSTALAGLLTSTQTFGLLQRPSEALAEGRPLFLRTTLISVVTAAYGCTQTIAILLTHQLTQEAYRIGSLDHNQQALDLENTAVVLSPLIPWNIAGLVPATLLMSDAGFIPYAVYLYLIPLWAWIRRPWQVAAVREGIKKEGQGKSLSLFTRF